jgi:hypothetical protein
MRRSRAYQRTLDLSNLAAFARYSFLDPDPLISGRIRLHTELMECDLLPGGECFSEGFKHGRT